MRKLLVLVAACHPPTEVRQPPSDVLSLRCEGQPSADPLHDVRMDLAATPLYPRRSGPRASERSRAGRPRALPQLEDALVLAAPPLHDCWNWASSRGAPEVSMDLAFTVSPFGELRDFATTITKGRAPELVACLQDTLGNLAIDDLSPRTTRMHARITFARVDVDTWLVRPVRPHKPRATPRPRTCMPILEAAADVLASPIVYIVEDANDSHGRPSSPITVTIGCPSGGSIMVGKDTIAAAIETNRGAYEACYADAVDRSIGDAVRTQQRHEPLSGTVELTLTLAGLAQPADITTTGAGDPDFHECLRDAAKDVWLAHAEPGIAIRAHATFELTPQAPDEPTDLRTLERSLASADGDMERCEIRAWIVEALARRRPWLDDPRLLAETRALAELAATLPYPDACLGTRIDNLLRNIAFVNGRPDFRWSSIARIEALLPIAEHRSWGAGLRWYHAASLAMTSDRNAEGVGILTSIARTGPEHTRDVAEQELARYLVPRRLIRPRCR